MSAQKLLTNLLSLLADLPGKAPLKFLQTKLLIELSKSNLDKTSLDITLFKVKQIFFLLYIVTKLVGLT